MHLRSTDQICKAIKFFILDLFRLSQILCLCAFSSSLVFLEMEQTRQQQDTFLLNRMGNQVSNTDVFENRSLLRNSWNYDTTWFSRLVWNKAKSTGWLLKVWCNLSQSGLGSYILLGYWKIPVRTNKQSLLRHKYTMSIQIGPVNTIPYDSFKFESSHLMVTQIKNTCTAYSCK